MIRPTNVAEAPALIEIARGTGVFKPHELIALEEVLRDYHAKPDHGGYHAFTSERDDQVFGFEIHGQNTMTDRTWDLYWIVVAKGDHARGLGTELLHFAEDDIRRQHGRLIIIETSSLPSYVPTRNFYLKHGYEQSAVVRDFYADGDDKVVFWKKLDVTAAGVR